MLSPQEGGLSPRSQRDRHHDWGRIGIGAQQNDIETRSFQLWVGMPRMTRFLHLIWTTRRNFVGDAFVHYLSATRIDVFCASNI
jgi:hypothetical protein